MTKHTIISAFAALISAITVIILIFYVVNPDRIAASPVTMELNILSVTEELCPDDIIRWDTTMDIHKPSTVQGFITIVNQETQATILSAPLNFPAINHWKPVIITRTSHWSIPDLPPGKYERILSITALGYDGQPAFSVIPFSVRENCE